MYRFIPETLLDVNRLAIEGRLAPESEAEDPAPAILA
jgi:hypothetical protein